MRTVDVIVLGAGMVGTSTALQLQRRGLDVALVDRRQPGEETSHGNAGIIERNGFLPPAFPGMRNSCSTLRWDAGRVPITAFLPCCG
ncbi:FAD-dependent oxidoreductase [Pannonibacter sp. Pt2-lr]